MRQYLMIARQKRISLAFTAQSSRDINWSIVRQANSIIFKDPGLHQPESERPDIKPKAKKAALVFKEIAKEDRIGVAYVYSDNFEGIIKSNLPSFWTDDLSYIYSQIDLSQIGNGVRSKGHLQTPINDESKLPSDTSLEEEILQLNKQGYGIEKIAKALGCTTWIVRKCLNNSR